MLNPIAMMLVFDDLTHAGAALEIETNGVYSTDPQSKQLVHHRPDSFQAEEALMGVSVDYIHSIYGKNDGEFESWWNDQDPNNCYGWPIAAIPQFSQAKDLSWLELPARFPDRSRYCPYNLFTIGRLLVTGRASPATIGTALERYGIYGTNSLGQLKIESEHGLIGMSVKDALADYIQLGFTRTWYEPKALNNMVYWSCGWPQEALPDFNAIAAEPIPLLKQATLSVAPVVNPNAITEVAAEPQEHFTGSTKSENANLAIIGGLLAILNGQLNCSTHPNFSSQNQIIDKLITELAGLPGTSERNLKEKFSKANRLIQDFLDPHGVSKAK